MRAEPRWWRRPWLHFVVLGGLLFALARGLPGAEAELSDEELLVREALALGLDRDDRLVRDRLVKLASFLEAGVSTTATLEQAARALQLERTDPVIRRYLAQLVELALAGPALEPDAGAIRARYEREVAAAAPPPRWRFTHVYLAADTRDGATLAAEAEGLLRRLRAERLGPAEAARLGDAFPLGSRGATASSAEVDRAFGGEVAAALASAAENQWVGPVRSDYGVHLLWLHQRIDPAPPPLESVRNRLALALTGEEREHRRRRRMAALRP